MAVQKLERVGSVVDRVELPFGGVEAFGCGREKGAEARLGFTQTKTVAVHTGDG